MFRWSSLECDISLGNSLVSMHAHVYLYVRMYTDNMYYTFAHKNACVHIYTTYILSTITHTRMHTLMANFILQALHNTQLLAHYAKIDKRVQVMGYVLKEFAKVDKDIVNM